MVKSTWKKGLEKSRRFKGMNLHWAITVTYSKTAREISAFHGFRFFARRSHKHRKRISIRQRKGETKSERSSYHAFWSALKAPLFQRKTEAKWKKEKYSPTTLYFLPPLSSYSLLPIVSLSFSFHSVSFAIVARCTDSHD